MTAPAPRLSVILPTFNRARFLPEAFASIRAQTWTDWELIVVDDGSTDGTSELVGAWPAEASQPIHYVHQVNAGAYAARNAGLDRASGRFIAFFDSDDLWLPHHLERCVEALEATPALQWAFAACQMTDAAGNVMESSTFRPAGRPHPFLALATVRAGGARAFSDPRTVERLLVHGIPCGLQNSVIRTEVFAHARFWPDYRVVEDSQFLLRALLRGVRIGYLDDVHVVYRIHEGNSSASATGGDRGRLRAVCEEKVRGLERLRRELTLTRTQQRAMNQNLAREYFWHLGYACCWLAHDRSAALANMRAALRLRPLAFRMWKTYAACLVKERLGAPESSAYV